MNITQALTLSDAQS